MCIVGHQERKCSAAANSNHLQARAWHAVAIHRGRKALRLVQRRVAGSKRLTLSLPKPRMSSPSCAATLVAAALTILSLTTMASDTVSSEPSASDDEYGTSPACCSLASWLAAALRSPAETAATKDDPACWAGFVVSRLRKAAALAALSRRPSPGRCAVCWEGEGSGRGRAAVPILLEPCCLPV